MLRSLITAALATVCLTLEATTAHLLPQAQRLVTLAGERPFALHRAVRLDDPTASPALRRTLAAYGCTLEAKAKARVSVRLVDTIAGADGHHIAGLPREDYALTVRAGHIAIEALSAAGVTRAAQTLWQLAEGYPAGKAAVEAVAITDWPAFAVRGFMHDTGRSFIPVDELRRQIDLLSHFKVNVFHWHLTEHLAWRFEVKALPALTDARHATRFAGRYYTQAECTALERYAAERGVTVIPEIDIPGHSAVFARALGYDMQSDRGEQALAVILAEVTDAFPLAPYIHIGGDEVKITRKGMLERMAALVRRAGRRVVMWNRLMDGPPTAAMCDMTQMWATSGRAVNGLPNIDCRYCYTNHFDTYADVVGIYKSNIYYCGHGNDTVAGTIVCTWNDTYTPTPRDITCQNGLYAATLAMAERAWTGGGDQYIEQGGTTLPASGSEHDAFASWERRFIFHKEHILRDEPIAYVGGSDLRWRITAPLPLDTELDHIARDEAPGAPALPHYLTTGDGATYGTSVAAGAGIYLRHIWHPTVPSYLSNPAYGQTVYAWTYVYSPRACQAAAQVETYTYSRSGNELAPPAGHWDRRGSQLWINGEEIAPPHWRQPDKRILQDQGDEGLTNENLTARSPVPVTLRQGWNKVTLRLPHPEGAGTGRDKWQFTFVITTPDGRRALPGLRYSPDKQR